MQAYHTPSVRGICYEDIAVIRKQTHLQHGSAFVMTRREALPEPPETNPQNIPTDTNGRRNARLTSTSSPDAPL